MMMLCGVCGHGGRSPAFRGVVLIWVLAVALGAASAWVPAEAADKGTIRLGYVLWDSEIASTHVVAAVLEDRLGYQVELTSVDAGPMWAGIASGDFDAIVAAWLPVTHAAYFENVQDRVLDLGPNLEGAKIGLVVPSYVTIDSIEELNQERSRFRGRIVGIDPGAGLMAATDRALEAYGLDFTLQDGSDAAMVAALSQAIRRNEWIVVTGWTPHWKFARWDLKYLEDPLGVYGGEERIHTIVTPSLKDRAPDAFQFLDRFYWTPDDMAEVMLMIQDGMEPLEAAREWIRNNPDKVEAWL